MRKLIYILILSCCIYTISYIVFRINRIEVWEKDGSEYVIFPKSQKWVYYLYRPATYVDSKITSMNFHIGEHQN
jgi:hypothetical protein